MNKLAITLLALGAIAANAAAVVVDGTAEAAYGSALFTQQNTTQFGNNTDNSFNTANGSEIDQAFGLNDGTNFAFTVAGNLESNFNKFVVFIDSKAGGFNTITNTNASGDDFGWLNGNAAGLTFDTGFDADYAIWIRHDGTNSFMTFAELGAGGDLETGGFATGSLFTGALTSMRLNNSNVGGVVGGGGGQSVPDGSGVVTGWEFQMALSTIGATAGSDIKVAGFVNSGGNFMSNQVIGGLPLGTGNLATTGNVNFNQFAGEQYVTVQGVPEPASMIALGAGLLALARRRRSK
ncbi:MAG TPA: PEP-CTERM sorting domain-containing protein [Fimbriimonadaceae bacterium]|nr:hypothetical protein [Armatimonadota bacterium]HRD31864.1 PEP-CTERM sorting domain-containing protein [Fimbriimonadaceae bacterium]HRE94856.1 PEP-CTERM sorting domain-containing protein [Fimbriimonadaceae bacterium]HRI74750.1 PEP-CTERM sorting domain-containing protein [Fimbriimonadaceae bacterium]